MLRRESVPATTVIDMPARNCPSASTSCGRGFKCGAFTLIELFVVMAVIIILMGLAFPAFNSVQNAAKKTQAKNDLVQIVTAVNAFYTEYGKYPTADTTEVTYGAGAARTNELIFNELRAKNTTSTTLNPRQIVFISPPDVKDATQPRSGIATQAVGASTPIGSFVDPWGSPYTVRIDADYGGDVLNPYGAAGGAGGSPIRQGVIAWSVGKNGVLGGGAAAGSSFSKESGTANSYTNSSDVISWQ